MYLIISWAIKPDNAWIVLDEDGNNESGNAVFKTMEDAELFALKHCQFPFTIVKLPTNE